MKRFLVIAAISSLMTACASTPTNSTNANNASPQAKQASTPNSSGNLVPAPGSDPSASAPDFSTPRSTVETFVKAADRRDVEVLSQCFDPQSAGEFKGLREKTASPDDLDKLAHQVGNASVIEATEKGDRATVKANFPSGPEEFSLKRSSAGWRILDF